MKKLKPWQKIGLFASFLVPVAVAAPTITAIEKGLEAKVAVAQAFETNPSGYEVPDLTGYRKIAEGLLDKDDDGVKETILEIYQNNEGLYITRYITDGFCWGWGRFRNRNDKEGIIIVDSDCDGVFDRKYAALEVLFLPDCLR